MTTSLRDFTVLQKLGEGSFGQVFRVRRNLDGQEYALKKVKLATMREKERENAVNEVRILASLSNEFVIGYKEAFFDESSQALCVIMEFAGGGDILKSVESHKRARTKFPESEIWRALAHMMSGLKTLHDNSILHRDLKCANVFRTAAGVYKLGDLNVSKVMKKGLAHTQTGTPYYASPEVWRDEPYDGKSDVWSLGCVLYEMAALRPPFEASDLQGLYRKKSIEAVRKDVRTPQIPLAPPLRPTPSYRALNSPSARPPNPNPVSNRPGSSREKKHDPLDDIIKEYENLKQKREERSRRVQNVLARQPSREMLRDRSSSRNSRDLERKPSVRYMGRQPSRENLKEPTPRHLPHCHARHDSVKAVRRDNSIDSLNRARSRNGSQDARRNISAIHARAEDVLTACRETTQDVTF
ncbi:serine/threonine-protein kinase Nek7-like [Hippocampus zosterae]|uniref:serine/threonine-protein kinase Nek7-like n=1 Tax=Hippocampus zosterae TaxID=109293 RepID=UPI00223CFC41|nr:serine/threonine-protein kinase Nek7-like [Hippocampus zosterae]